jgi:type IV pilus assembly protein PilM
VSDLEQTPEEQPTEAVPSLPAGDYGWLTAGFNPNDVPEAMPAISPPPVTSMPEPPPPLPVEVPVAAPVVELEPETEVFLGAEEPSTPFWKKDLSFKRGPKAARAPKAEKQKREKQPKAPREKKVKERSTEPFWKKDLSLKAKGEKAAKEPKAPKEPKERKPPIWKRELKLGAPKLERTPKAAKQPKGKPKKAIAGKAGFIGLKIGASQVAAARVGNGPTPQLLQVAREPLVDGIVVGGELRDVEGLASALKELFGKNKLPKKNVRLGIANNRIGVRTFEISGIDDAKQLANAIRFRAQETLPIPLEEAALDWQVLAESTDPETGQTTRRVLLVVAYRELVDRYVMACKKAGIKLAGIDLEAFAMLRAVTAPSAPDAPPPAGAQVVVNVGHDRSTFAVSDGRNCEFTRVLGWGGQNFSVAIARALDITPSEAQPIKHALSLVAQYAPPEGVSPETMAKARDAVIHELQAFARELVSSLRFYQGQEGSLGIGEVVLTGGTAHLPGFADELHRLIGVPVRVADPLNRVAVPKKFREPDDYSVGSLTIAIGLGIED